MHAINSVTIKFLINAHYISNCISWFRHLIFIYLFDNINNKYFNHKCLFPGLTEWSKPGQRRGTVDVWRRWGVTETDGKYGARWDIYIYSWPNRSMYQCIGYLQPVRINCAPRVVTSLGRWGWTIERLLSAAWSRGCIHSGVHSWFVWVVVSTYFINFGYLQN